MMIGCYNLVYVYETCSSVLHVIDVYEDLVYDDTNEGLPSKWICVNET